MTERKSAFASLGGGGPPPEPTGAGSEPEAQEEAPRRKARKSDTARTDTIHIGGYFRPEVDVMLDDLALKLKREGRRVTRQQLLGMALNKLFRAHGFQPIAREKP